MMPHVDRSPLVASAILSVAQDVDEPWPFEVYHHETGLAHNVTLKPGEMLLFESHSVIHGHPFPLVGRYAAYLFVHFEPTGKTLYRDETGSFHYDDEGGKEDSVRSGSKSDKIRDTDGQYREAVKDRVGGQSSASDGRLPPYLIRESPEEENWRRFHQDGWSPVSFVFIWSMMLPLFRFSSFLSHTILSLIVPLSLLHQPYELLPPHAHAAAKSGELEKLKKLLDDEDEDKVLTERDKKGWQILHVSFLTLYLSRFMWILHTMPSSFYFHY